MMYERLTLKTATGLPFLSLAFHATMGVTALTSGIIAIATRKGGNVHRRAGTVFVYAMIAMGLTAVGISLYERKNDVLGGALAAYLVFTGWTTLRPMRGAARGINIALMILTMIFVAGPYRRAMIALGMPGSQLDGVPAGMMFFLATVFLLAAIGDFRMLFAGGVEGSRRLARHLWRMCFGLFIASGSFAAQLVKMSFVPPQFRSMPVILLLGGGPLVVLVYWMWRIRWKANVDAVVTLSNYPT